VKLLDRTGWKSDGFSRAESAGDASAVIVPLATLDVALAERRAGQPIGVDLPNDSDPADLRTRQAKVDLIAIAFPKYGDGRGFSIAKALRDQGFSGILRASGSIIPDQFAFALQCGFDEVEIEDAQAERQPIGQWLHALTLIHGTYQDGPDGSVSVFRRRHQEAEAVKAA
jgi:uncharacterized protein (DUF934 family)